MMCWMWAAVSEVLQSEWKSPWGQEVHRGLAGGEASDLVSPGGEGGRGVEGRGRGWGQRYLGVARQSWMGLAEGRRRALGHWAVLSIGCSPAAWPSPECPADAAGWRWSSPRRYSCCAGCLARPLSHSHCWCSTPGHPAGSPSPPHPRPGPLLEHKDNSVTLLFICCVFFPLMFETLYDNTLLYILCLLLRDTK